jgi:hypothetical protein
MANAATNINLNEDLTKGLTVFKNIDQEVLLINTDKVKLLLIEHDKIVRQKMDWLAPFGIFITVLITLLTTNIEKILFGLSRQTWQALFILICIGSGILTLFYALRAIKNCNKGTIVELIEKLKSDSS